jgi:phosphatidate cytidylyltransferase
VRQRATSAAVLVPLLLVVIALGGFAVSIAIALITLLAAREAFALLRVAGHPALPALGAVLALTVILDATFPGVLEGSGPPIPSGAPLEVLGAERGWIVLLILAVWSYDTGAYLVGRRFGRERFLTHISPSKTYAGLVGGVLATTVVVGLLLAGLGQTPIHAVLLGPLAALAAQAGDLAESLL